MLFVLWQVYSQFYISEEHGCDLLQDEACEWKALLVADVKKKKVHHYNYCEYCFTTIQLQ
eukprot:m.51620 g.51620  ORF g.51620 m.51620 type:complete len:60 (-) comp10743_c0_seq3:98-277(-)